MAAAAAGGGASRSGRGLAPPQVPLGILLAGARGGTLLLTFAAGSWRLARGSGAALHLGRQLGNRDLAGGRGLSGHKRLRLPHPPLLGGAAPHPVRRGAAGEPESTSRR